MPDNDVSNVRSRYKQITKRINLDYYNSSSETDHSLYVGSYGRGTAIHLSDVDIIVELPSTTYKKFDDYSDNGQSSLLQEVRDVLKKTYSTSHISGNGQVVVISFADGITFEVVPAFINKAGSYTYPDTNNGGSWKSTNPKPEIAAISSMNATTNKNLKRLCRMMRAWKDRRTVPLKGLLIDTLAYNFLQDWVHKDKSYLYYDLMTRDFLEYLSLQTNKTYYFAPGSKERVYVTGAFSRQAAECLEIAEVGISKESDCPRTAKSKWREIYGTKFPS